jgi:UDP-N-acetyl-D-glucosamine dehydrogenase
MSPEHDHKADFQTENILTRIASRDYTVGIMGMGYVGLPLALVALEAGFRVVGFDIDRNRIELLRSGRSGIKHIASEPIARAVAAGKLHATDNLDELGQPDAILIAVPTPLSKQREPDLTYVENSTRSIAKSLRRGQLIILESTTWPGTTREVMKPILEAEGMKAGRDFFLAYSPEREDPGNVSHSTGTIPKVVGADDTASLRLGCALYGSLVSKVVPVSTAATAEAVKLTENIFRSVNIALVNELKLIFDRMGIDVWEVIEAAKTKPFGFMPFYPGPGLGGHCIPIDPFYLTWKAREFEVSTRFIELSGQINTAMPYYVVSRLAEALDETAGRGLKGARVVVIGLSYKKNIDDTRESPSLKLIDLIERRGAQADYYDPFIPEIPLTREHAALAGRKSIEIDSDRIRQYDAVVISTDHDAIDWKLITTHARLVIDTRNVCARNNLTGPNVVKA